ncbi:ABC transporter ATP-binding protein/permease [Gynuella sp.]|uniref:ABC transporter ATP-binding protein/permease n=1 Tax=Gynuella sp. TaxID=2969146 RepID=UPI003D0996FE
MKSSNDSQLMQWLRQQSQPFQSTTRKVVLAAVLQFIVQLASLYLIAVIAQTLIIHQQRPSAVLLGELILCLAAQLLFHQLKAHQQTMLRRQVMLHFQQALHQRLQQYSLALSRSHSNASWQSFFLKRIPALQGYYCDYLTQQRIASIIPLIVLAVVMPLSWLAGLLLLLSAPLVPLFMWIVGVGAANAHRQHFLAIERLGGIFLDRLKAKQLLTVFDRTDAEKQLFEQASEQLKTRTLKVVSLAFLSSSVLDFFATIAMALVAVIIGFSLLGDIPFGNWGQPMDLQKGLFVLLLAPLFFAELKTLGRFYHSKAEALGAAQDLQQIIARPVDVPHDRSSHHELHWREVSILHDGGQPLIQIHQLDLHPGDKVLLQGPSGAGKSTLLEALMGQRTLSCEQPVEVLQWQQISWLGQQAVLLPGTVRENLTLGHPRSDEQLWQVLQRVELSDWVTQSKQQLDTPLGEHPPLSGGQQQRLALARILLFDQPVIFLDEPTAHLASEQQQRLTELLQQLLQEKTVIWISHRLLDQDFFTHHWTINAEQRDFVQQEIERHA